MRERRWRAWMKSRVVGNVIGHFFGSSLQTPQSEWITQTRGGHSVLCQEFCTSHEHGPAVNRYAHIYWKIEG